MVPNIKTDPFFTRLTNPHLGVQTAMILLRFCGIPKMSYLLRVTPPEAIGDIAAQFDLDALYVTHKLLGTEGYAPAHTPDVTQQLQAPLRYGGFGITSAAARSHAAYLASVANAASAAALHTYTGADTPLPSNTMLHTQLTQSITTIKNSTPSCNDILPESPSSFFTYYQHESTVPVSGLQSALNSRATKHLFNAAIDRAESKSDIAAIARLKSITAPHASDWKATLPSNNAMTLSDIHYRIAALFNLGISLPHLPPDCHGCGGKNIVATDPYHYLSCTAHKRKEITIGHNMVVHVLYKYNHLTGGAGVKEPKDLHGSDGRCPDLQMVSNNEHIITDVQITNPLCPTNQKGAARKQLFAAERVREPKPINMISQHNSNMPHSSLSSWKQQEECLHQHKRFIQT